MTSWSEAARRAPGLHARPLPSIQPLGWALGTLCVFRERARQRAALASLDERLLADVGLTREQARQEIRKPFWRP